MAKSAEPPRRQAALRNQAEALLQDQTVATPPALEPRSPDADLRALHELQVYQVELELQNEELRRAQRELSLAQARYYDLFDRAPTGYCTLNGQGLILETNQAAATLLGLDRGRLQQQPFARFLPPGEAETCRLLLRQAVQTGGLQSWGARLVRGDGTMVSVLLQASAAEDAQNGLEYRLVLNDLTASLKTQDTLRKLSTAVEQSPTSVVITDTTGAIEYVNPKFTEMTGYTLTEVAGQTMSIFKSGHSSPEVYRKLWDTLRSGRTWHGEFQNRKKDGELFWEEAWIAPVKDAQGTLAGYVGVKEDITERKRAEAELGASEAKWRSLFDILPIGLSMLDDQHRLKEFNPALPRILQIDPEALRQGTYLHRKYLRPDGSPLPREEFPSVRAAQEQATFRACEIGVQREEGGLIWAEVSAAPLNVPGYSAVLTTTDVTARRRIEDALRTREAMLARTEAIAHVGSWEWDIATGVVTWSEEMFRIFQRDPAQGAPPFIEQEPLYHPEDWAHLSRLAETALREGTSFETELRLLLPAGETRVCLGRGHTEVGADGKVHHLFGSLQDITAATEANRLLAASREQLRTLLTRLQRAQEDERIQVSRLVHDELGQLLTELKLDLGWLERRLSEVALPPELTLLLDKVMETTELAETTIQTVQRIAEELRPNTVESLGLLASLRQEARRFEKHTGIPCATEVEEPWPELEAGPALELFYICREALTNVARHAGATLVRLALRLEADSAVIEVSDDGVGMTEAQWTGPRSLGLLGMRERATQLGGAVSFHRNQPHGTCLTVRLPWPGPAHSGRTDS